jgi:hypothetical protein
MLVVGGKLNRNSDEAVMAYVKILSQLWCEWTKKPDMWLSNQVPSEYTSDALPYGLTGSQLIISYIIILLREKY